jgi:hypothetical protein
VHFRNRALTRALTIIPVLCFASTISPSISGANSHPEWLQVANRYRASAGLSEVIESPDATAGALAHGRYMIRNNYVGHEETRGKPGYSEAGNRAGTTGNVSSGDGPAISQREAVESWLTVPFHGVNMLSPDSTRFGYAIATDATNTRWAASMPLFWDRADGSAKIDSSVEAMAADLVSRDTEVERTGYSWTCRGARCVLIAGSRVFVSEQGKFVERPEIDPRNAERDGLAFGKTVVFPGPGSGVPLIRFAGNEYPDPLPSCGYQGSAGLPIYVLRGKPTEVAEATLVDRSGTKLPLCTISATTYRNPKDGVAQQLGRDVLQANGAVVLLPRQPLQFGQSYDVRVKTTDGEAITWSFHTTNNGAIDLPVGDPKANEPTVGQPSQTSKSPDLTETLTPSKPGGKANATRELAAGTKRKPRAKKKR